VPAPAQLPLQIIGPEGIGAWIRTVLGNSYVGMGRLQLQIHELRGLEAFNNPSNTPPVSGVRPLKSEIPGELHLHLQISHISGILVFSAKAAHLPPLPASLARQNAC
jgi:hypothetical protein